MRNLSATFSLRAVLAAVLLLPTASALAAEGFQPLFDGKSIEGWQNAKGEKPGSGWTVDNGAMTLRPGAGDIWTEKRYGNFVLELEFKTAGNSGVFIRTDQPADNVQTGLEIQVDNPRKPSKHSVGAIYDLVAPVKDAAKKDDWNHLRITAIDNILTVELNMELIAEMNLDLWTEPNKSPDGTKNKFSTALRDFKREGHIGFQDHGAAASYRNIQIKPVTALTGSKP